MSENCESLRFVVVVCISQVTYAHVYIFASDFQDEFCLLFLCLVWFNRPFQGMHNQNHCCLTAGSGGTEMDGQQQGLKELKINPLKNASIFSLLFFRWMNDPPVDPSVDDDHSSLNELQAHHFDSSAVKASNSRPRDRGRPHASPLPTGSSKSFGKHCYKWNEDPHNCGGAITLTRVSCATPLSTVLCFIVPDPLIRKNRPPIDHILLLRQRPIHPFQMVLLHGSRLHFLLIRICTVYVLSRDISTLGARNGL